MVDWTHAVKTTNLAAFHVEMLSQAGIVSLIATSVHLIEGESTDVKS